MANGGSAIRGRAPIITFVCLLLILLTAPAWAEKAPTRAFGSDSDTGRIEFDIGAEPLSNALERFMSATSVAVVVDSALLAGRRSAPLKGLYAPEAALRTILSGTGLNVVAIGPGAFTVLPPSPGARPLPSNLHYAAAIQSAVTAALCQQSDTRLMQYRAVLRLWLDPAGVVTRVELASSTGDSSIDTTIAATLQDVEVDLPRPDGLPQPVKLAILPDVSGGSACAGNAAPTIRVRSRR